MMLQIKFMNLRVSFSMHLLIWWFIFKNELYATLIKYIQTRSGCEVAWKYSSGWILIFMHAILRLNFLLPSSGEGQVIRTCQSWSTNRCYAKIEHVRHNYRWVELSKLIYLWALRNTWLILVDATYKQELKPSLFSLLNCRVTLSNLWGSKELIK